MKKTNVMFIIDKSGSMSLRRDQVVEDFNQQVEAMKANVERDPDLEINVSLLIFDHRLEVVFQDLPLEKVEPLSLEQYRPEGWTALFDALDEGMNIVLPKMLNPNDAALVIVITDGEENASKRPGSDKVPSRIKELETTDQWTFTYLGTDKNLAEFTGRLGSHAGNTISGMDQLSTGLTTNMHGHYWGSRSAGHTSIQDAYRNK